MSVFLSEQPQNPTLPAPSGELPPVTPARPGCITRLFGALMSPFRSPRLPGSLVLFVVLLILAEGGLSLINQPTDYWLDYERTSFNGIMRPIFVAGPAMVVVSYLGFALAAVLLLRLFNLRLALILWAGLAYYQLHGVEGWLNCGFGEWLTVSDNSMGCMTYRKTVAITLAAVGGLLLTALLRPALPALAAAVRRRRAWLRAGAAALFSIIWLAGLGAGIVRSAQVEPYGWMLVESTHHPRGRASGAIAYDTLRNRAVLFGGATEYYGSGRWNYQDDTWEWDGQDWVLMKPETRPPARVSHDMAFDEARGVVVMFGGYNNDGPMQDTWEWDGENWTLFCPACSPPAREGHQMFYDPERGRVVVYGGYDHYSVFFHDAWEWDGQDWSEITFKGPAPEASAHSAAYDPAQERVVVFGAGWPLVTWTWQDMTWTESATKLQPESRGSADMVYDPIRQHMVLFGGDSNGRQFGDTWLLRGDTWTRTASALHPAPRWGHNLFFDRVRGRVMLFGGFGDDQYFHELWELVLPETLDD